MKAPFHTSPRRRSLWGVLLAVALILGWSGAPAHAVKGYTLPKGKPSKAPLEQGRNINLLRKPQHLQKRGPATYAPHKQFKRKGHSYGTLSKR